MWLIVCSQEFPDRTYIPQRLYCQGAAVPDDATGKTIQFATHGGEHFPAALAHAGHFDHLANRGEVIFTEQDQTINLRIEVFIFHAILNLLLIPFLYLQWPGYDGWGAQVGIMSPR